MSDILSVGIRVVRGIDWEWGDQDGGEGHVGTIIEFGGQGSSKNPTGTVVVAWDSGVKANYRAGFNCKDDLRVLDNGPAGVMHRKIYCDECQVHDFGGIRWKCAICVDYDLCNNCYTSDKHDTKHAFDRIDTLFSQSVRVPVRDKASRIQAKGLYINAEVTRGHDWEYQDQDGGDGTKGTVTRIANAENDTTSRSWVDVTWANGASGCYRRGHEGLLDIKVETPSDGELYYVNHLPKLEDYSNNKLQVGDFVKLKDETLSVKKKNELKQAGFLDAAGRVTDFDCDNSLVDVVYGSGSGKKVAGVKALYLSKIRKLMVGDTVEIINSDEDLRELQQGHGGYESQMNVIVGKTGKVVNIDNEGDVKVEIAGRKWLLNPQCCILQVPSRQQRRQTIYLDATNEMAKSNSDDSSDDDSDDDDDTVSRVMSFIEDLVTMGAKVTIDPKAYFVSKAAEGNVSEMQTMLKRFPLLVNEQAGDVEATALQLASHQGHCQIVTMLLKAGAQMDISDHQGDMAIHYAAFGNRSDTMSLLLKKSVSTLNAVNAIGQTALHISVYKQQTECIKLLLSYKCDVNVQDQMGDTPLHDALGRGAVDIVDMLLATKKIDFELQNAKGFNVVHKAAKLDCAKSLARILSMAPHLVNVTKPDGFTPLHLATLNGNLASALVLIDVGKANLEITNCQFHTALLIAINAGETPLIELLTLRGAYLDAEDCDGDTALLNALLQLKSRSNLATALHNITFLVDLKQIDKVSIIKEIAQKISGTAGATAPVQAHLWLAVALFLVTNGADLEHKNRINRTPMDEAATGLKELFLACKPDPTKQTPHQALSKPKVTGSKCMMCTTEPIGVTFRPCGHSVACVECSSRMKQCFSCHERIQQTLMQPSASAMCMMCSVEPVGITFRPCGHSIVCVECSSRMKKCFKCHKPLKAKLQCSGSGTSPTTKLEEATSPGTKKDACRQQ